MDVKSDEKRWQKVKIDPPYARHQHTICGFRKGHPRRANKQMFMFGGINMPENILFNDLWVFDFKKIRCNLFEEEDIEDCTFTEMECSGSIPLERKGHTALCYADSMYVFGGQTQDLNHKITDTIWILNLDSFVWSNIDTSLAKITPRSQISITWLSESTILVKSVLTASSSAVWRTRPTKASTT